MKYRSRFFYDVHGCDLEYVILAKHVLTLLHDKHALVSAILSYNLSHLHADDIDEIYRRILNIIKTTDEELETIDTVTRCKVQSLRYEVRNNEALAKYTDGLCTLYIHAADENGLLRINFAELAYWDFLILSSLQKELINEHNRRIKKIK